MDKNQAYSIGKIEESKKKMLEGIQIVPNGCIYRKDAYDQKGQTYIRN